MNTFIWGTGRAVGEIVGKWINDMDIIGFIDNDSTKKEYMNIPVYLPCEIGEYDAIVVANSYTKEIRKQCIELGIDLKKVIFLYNNYQILDYNQDYEFIARVLGENFAATIKNSNHIIRSYSTITDQNDIGNFYVEDYVRIRIFDMVVKEIEKRKLKGAVGELGVFRGEFAQYINQSFPNKNCYLFDTFKGFNNEEASKEICDGNATKLFVEAFKNTTLQNVIARMPNKDKIIIKQGFFPDSLDGLEEEWAFVSIDVDFGESILSGLEYFYPRLLRGGYIFIHDYNSQLLGVEKAVNKYELDNNLMLAKVPICDSCGTLIITK